MSMSPKQSQETAITLLQEDVARIENDLKEVRVFVTGNGDPKRGLLWLCADLGQLVSTLSKLVTEQQNAFNEHIEKGHGRRGSTWNLSRLGYDILKQAAGYLVFIILILIGLGARDWLSCVGAQCPRLIQ